LTVSHEALRRRAHERGIQLSYTAQDGRRVQASESALVATMTALGDPMPQTMLQPVMVRQRSGVVSAPVVVDRRTDLDRLTLTVTDGDTVVCSAPVGQLTRRQVDRPGSDATTEVTVSLAGTAMAPGYYELSIDGGAPTASALLLVPPRARKTTTRGLGVFAPLYGLRGPDDEGVGTFSDLAALADFVGSVGGDLVGTLPMYPVDWRPPSDPSPYLPVSRLFLNEIFIDTAVLPELARSAAARSVIAATDFRRRAAALSEASMVGYDDVMALKRQVLELCAAELFRAAGPRQDQFEQFLDGHPELHAYAGFRARAEQPAGDAATAAAARYHQYVQFAADEQLRAAGSGPGRAGLYLDLPVGVHPSGFDTWSRPELFAAATVGAPPDRLAPQGQAWGFPPLHPERVREERYRYVISCYRQLFAYSKAIRIDHVLGLQRLFWIPAGADATAGAYVRYRSEELRAIVAIEAERAGAVVVGEDLGTVSADIRRAMDRDAMLHTFVYQFNASAECPFPQPRSPSMASLGSHDTARFAAFWQGSDIDDRLARGVTSPAAADTDRGKRRALVEAVEAAETATDAPVGRAEHPDPVRRAFLTCAGALAEGPAAYLMVDLADIEGETVPDNRPGTGPEADNWRWRQRRALPEITADPQVHQALVGLVGRRSHREREE
jgi:4-alpha-glucanotransferase